MKQIIFFFLKPLSFLPALAMMYVIYGFSAQDASASGNLSFKVSYKIVEIGNEVLERGLDETEIEVFADRIEYPVRKLAHMTEYFMLAVAVSFPFYVYGLRGFPLMLVAGLICVAFAAGDEYHQSFVAGRGPSVKDVGIDSIGAFFGILTVQIICWVFLAPARSARRQEEFAYRKRARREEAHRRQEAIRREDAARRRRRRYY
ncbi:MAG: VanZ family protein [Ruminococcus sp.]|uniref:VanZ family protein n=1 Tax=Schaedlerella arabinosiphila TaxID=2044587 RepID=UPI002557FD7A|nr:VanZ family protein [Schaedlerella arabinosiphila]MCI9603449.1 VanZ family protein [Ruminococcus sp.]MCI9632005.1 VanZ family protein [Ruminococcus sp.]